MLIVNGDDFGYSREVNAAVAEAFRIGLISSTSLMANGAAFSEACDLARREGLTNRIGIHLTLTEGESLTDEIRRFSKFCSLGGQFHFRRERHFWLTASERSVLRGELAAQIERCQSEGLPLSHADSHHHSHTEFTIFRVLSPVLRCYRVPFLRLTDNVRHVGMVRRLYKLAFNRAVRRAGLAGAHYFCDVQGLARLAGLYPRDDVVIEVMVHPAYRTDGALVEAGSNLALADALQPALRSCRLGSYAELRS